MGEAGGAAVIVGEDAEVASGGACVSDVLAGLVSFSLSFTFSFFWFSLPFSPGLQSKYERILSLTTNFRKAFFTSFSEIEEGLARDEVQIEPAISEKKNARTGGLWLACSLGFKIC